MSTTFTPKLDILPPAQQRLWQLLSSTPPEFTLYGGTAIALQLGHRFSEDFDFFALQTIDIASLYDSVPYLKGSQVIQRAPNTLTCLVGTHSPIKVSFFGLPNLQRLEDPLIAEGNNLPVASLLDLAGTKVEVVQHRAQAKDYIDIDALIHVAGIDLPTQLAAGKGVYGDVFVPIATLKALTYFEDGDLPQVPDAVKKRLIAASVAVDPLRLPSLTRGPDNKARDQ